MFGEPYQNIQIYRFYDLEIWRTNKDQHSQSLKMIQNVTLYQTVHSVGKSVSNFDPSG